MSSVFHSQSQSQSHTRALAPAPAFHPNVMNPSTPKMQLGNLDDCMSDSDASSASPNGHGHGHGQGSSNGNGNGRLGSRCLCGRIVQGEGIYCSVACARSDAFSSLCYKPTAPFGTGQLANNAHANANANANQSFPTLGSSVSRNPSITSTISASSAASASAGSDWEASHYRRVCRADLRREERKEERRRRRADGNGNVAGIAPNIMSLSSALPTLGSAAGPGPGLGFGHNHSHGHASTSSSASAFRGTMMSSISSSTSSSRVPDLVGGGGMHSRNPSTASSVGSFSSSTWGPGGLSRNPSTASAASASSSRRGYGGGTVDMAIMEDEDEEEEWLVSNETRPLYPGFGTHQPAAHGSGPGLNSKGYHHQHHPQARHHRRNSTHRKKKLESFGMGKDMCDVLEEIIQMEKGFTMDDSSATSTNGDEDDSTPPPATGLFTAVFDRPPKTPPPAGERRQSVVAPNAPYRGHRKSMSNGGMLNQNHVKQTRPPSFMGFGGMGHQSSLSESHTMLYLATASPERPSQDPNAPFSSRLKARNSLTFTPDKAGPAITPTHGSAATTAASASASAFRAWDSTGMNLTPSRRRGQISPSAQHPTMDNWRFPSASVSTAATGTGTGSDTGDRGSGVSIAVDSATPTRAQAAFITPTRPTLSINTNASATTPTQPAAATAAATTGLLWPPPQPPNLAPALFPSSPGTGEFTPEMSSARPRRAHAGLAVGIPVPGSGLRLGVVCGNPVAGAGDVDMDVDADSDDDGSTAMGHGHGSGATYLPVFLEAEGFQRARGW